MAKKNTCIEIDGTAYELQNLEMNQVLKGAWIHHKDGGNYLIVQVMHDLKEPYMMIRALDGSKIKLVDAPDFKDYKLIKSANA
jgi:hypothetical protein